MVDLIGQQFGRWKVIEKYGIGDNSQRLWLCECQCDLHTQKILSTSKLNSGKTLSCGCYRKEANRQRFHKTNVFNLTGEYGIGYTAKGEEFYFDLEDYDLIKDYCWRIGKHGYVETTICQRNKSIIYTMHVMLLGKRQGYEIDHIYGKKNDNRKSQLRWASHSNNIKNAKTKSNNSSGCTGVSFVRGRNKCWKAYIFVNNKQKHLGYFYTKEEAIIKRKEAEKLYFGDFAPYKKEG